METSSNEHQNGFQWTLPDASQLSVPSFSMSGLDSSRDSTRAGKPVQESKSQATGTRSGADVSSARRAMDSCRLASPGLVKRLPASQHSSFSADLNYSRDSTRAGKPVLQSKSQATGKGSSASRKTSLLASFDVKLPSTNSSADSLRFRSGAIDTSYINSFDVDVGKQTHRLRRDLSQTVLSVDSSFHPNLNSTELPLLERNSSGDILKDGADLLICGSCRSVFWSLQSFQKHKESNSCRRPCACRRQLESDGKAV